MAQISVYNEQGKEQGTIELADAVFAVPVKNDVVHQVYVALESNARERLAHVKDRSEVRGGGKKPWKQKGTGRARHGSTRSPIWSGGGVTFGPTNERNFKKQINKKMSRLAMRMCVSGKVADGGLIVVTGLPATGKTKDIHALRNKLPGAGKTTLILGGADYVLLGREVRNIPNIHVQRVDDVNVADMLHHQYIVATEDAVRTLELRLS